MRQLVILIGLVALSAVAYVWPTLAGSDARRIRSSTPPVGYRI
ncbi:MAG: hypothetical protein R3C10_00865 [Pirellulales bacterium]